MNRIARIRSLSTLALLLAACAVSHPPAAAKPEATVISVVPAATPPGPDRTHVPPKGPPPQLRLPAQTHFTLANGLRVRLVESHRLPIVALNLVSNAGAAHDPADRPGLASMTAEVMTEGTRGRTATQISDEIGFIGGSLDASAGFDAASLVGASLSRELPKLADIFADVAMNPTFPQRDFARVQDERLVSLLQQRDQPPAVAAKAFAGVFWGKHPYGHWAGGTEEAVKAMKPAELARFHARYWTPANSELIVVGDTTEIELRRVLGPTLGAWKPGKAQPLPAPAAPAGALRTVLVTKPNAPQSYLLLGSPGLPRSSPDYVAARVAFEVLGGGMSSRLFRNLREAKGYTYGIGAREEARKLGGTSVIAGSVKAQQTGEAMKDLLAEVGKLRDDPVPAAELQDAKDAIVLGLPAEFSTVGGIAGKLAETVVHALPDDYWNRFANEVRAVTAEDVQRVARRYLDPARLTIVMVGAPEVVTPQLDGIPIGPIEVRPPPAAGPGPKPAKAAPAAKPAAAKAAAGSK
ncbi:MAG TPA: pitrilysin family protein [Anaeromyxobacteraceae bacterium]|nr:pitrilysin family protein [Anaeromyxobacteraceae bacterium]